MSLLHQTKEFLRRALATYEVVLLHPFRQTAYKSYAKEDDLFMMICFSEFLGLPNPISYYTLPLYPYYAKRFHQWHQRMGMKQSPLDTIKCC